MEALLCLIAKQLVDHPDKIRVSQVKGNHTIVMQLQVARDDIGKVIGRDGRMAQALRTIMCAISSKNRERMILEIVE